MQNEFEHLWKDMYLVRSFVGVQEAARHRARNREVRLNNSYSMEDKYPLIVVLSGTPDHMHVAQVLTDTTLHFCLAKLEEFR